MYKDLIGERVNVVVSSRGDTILEYVGTLSNENEDAIEFEENSDTFLYSSTASVRFIKTLP